MRDKIINYTLGVSLLLLLVLLPTSCAKEDNVGEKASVTMTFFTRAESNTQVSGGDLLPNERMETLRVIVARNRTGEVLYNVKYDRFDEDENGRLYKTITFSELTVEKEGENFDFYAIANEEGVGYTEKSWDNITVNDLKNMNLQSTFLTNANASTNTLIPQTAYKQITVKPQPGGGIQSNSMELNFAVAKVSLTITNESAGDQYVNDINLSGVNMESTPLFAGEPLSAEKQGNLSLGNLRIHAGEPATVYAYFFENAGGEYNLTASWKNTPQILNIKEVAMINEISRGTELDINITLNATTTPTFNIEVVPWTTIEVDVPPFN